MKEQLTKLGFLDWLQSLEDPAPYPVMFFEVPKFIQQSYIQRWLREVHLTHIEVNVNIMREWYFTGYDLSDPRCAEIPEMYYSGCDLSFEKYEEALEAGLYQALKIKLNKK